MTHRTQIIIGIIAILAILLVGCDDDAQVAISKAADNFEAARRVIFYNGISLK